MAGNFAAHDAGLNPFLFSDVGTEPNGTGLTILSLLARLGKDPWDEAASWSRKPRDVAIASLTDSILQMPPNAQASTDAHRTASRLVALLPVSSVSGAAAAPSALKALALRKQRWLPLLYVAVFVMVNLLLMHARKPDGGVPSVTHTPAAMTK